MLQGRDPSSLSRSPLGSTARLRARDLGEDPLSTLESKTRTPVESSSSAKRKRARIVTLIALCVAVGALLRVAGLIRERVDLKPRTDSLEYGLGAAALVERGDYLMHIGEARYPPRYPPGYSVIAAPFVAAAGNDPSAAWRAAFVAGLAAIALAGVLGAVVAGAPGAFAAAVLVAGSPEAILSSGFALTESTSLTLALIAVLSSLRAARGSRTLSWLLLAGCVTGLAVLVKATNAVFVLPAVGVALLGPRARDARRSGLADRALRLAVCAVPAASGVLALFAVNAVLYGAPFTTGYHYWVPRLYTEQAEHLFKLHYALHATPGFSEAGNTPVYFAWITGLRGSLVLGVFAPLIALGLARLFLWRPRTEAGERARDPLRLAARTALLPVLALIGFQSFHMYQDTRLMQPLLASVAVCVALGAAVVHAALARLASRAGARARAVVPALGLALLLGVPLAGPVARAWEHGYSTGPPLVAQLPAVDLVLPPRALCIVNFPLGIAAFHLGEGRELWVGDRDSSDDLVNMAAIQPVKSYDGNPNGVHYLSSFLGVLDEEVARVVERARAGEDVFLVLSLGEGKEGAGIARLRETLATEVVLESWPVTVERLTARPEGER